MPRPRYGRPVLGEQALVPRYFFDIFDGELVGDDEGCECAEPQAVWLMAMETLPAIARDSIPKNGDRQAFTVLVRDEANVTVYTATLTFAGLWIGDEIPPVEPDDL